MTINDLIVDMMAKGEACKDFMTFLSIHSKGNVLNLGLCEKACGVVALLHGIEGHGGHLWTVNPYCIDCMKIAPFFGHPQWTLIETDPLDHEYLRTTDIPEELDLLYINPNKDRLDTTLTLKSWGQRVKTTGLIVVCGVKEHQAVQDACDDYAKSYGMKFHIRQAQADLGVIFYPDNKEALKNV